ncbi:MAG: CocE/NonD family hydrolase, partial [Myxococcales bacterium]|nr:CocE/NonD family hydrolase [Myxococcales bacterium]
RHLLDVETGIEGEPRVHYYTLGEESWKAADTWPPPGTETRTLFLAPGDVLAPEPPKETDGADAYEIDFKAGTGDRARWNCLIFVLGPVGYFDRAERDRRLLTYTSAPLDRDWEVTGHPIVTLHVSADAPDAAVFAYLEDVDPRGRVHYVTEGMLRALHRRESNPPSGSALPIPHRTFARGDAAPLVPGEPAELRFDLLPISYRFFRGHRIRVALAGADADHFAPVPDGARVLTIHRSAALPSSIELPVMPAPR